MLIPTSGQENNHVKLISSCFGLEHASQILASEPIGGCTIEARQLESILGYNQLLKAAQLACQLSASELILELELELKR